MAVLSKLWIPGRRDIIWIDFNPQAGSEMKDEHPMLVLSTAEFNSRTGIVIGLPMTHSTANENNPFALKIIGSDLSASYILTHQPKSFDWRTRRARPHPLKQASQSIFSDACQGLNSIISI